MKKLVYTLAAVFAVAMVSCGGNKAAEADTIDTIDTTVVEVAEAADSNETVIAAEAETVEAPAETPAAE